MVIDLWPENILFATGIYCTRDHKTGSGAIAQRLEQGAHNALVGGSNPSRPTILRRRLRVALASKIPKTSSGILRALSRAYHSRKRAKERRVNETKLDKSG